MPAAGCARQRTVSAGQVRSGPVRSGQGRSGPVRSGQGRRLLGGPEPGYALGRSARPAARSDNLAASAPDYLEPGAAVRTPRGALGSVVAALLMRPDRGIG